MKHTTKIANTQEVKAMVDALQELVELNKSSGAPKLTFEIDFEDAQAVRLTREGKNRPLFWALCKGGDIWLVNHPRNLFV